MTKLLLLGLPTPRGAMGGWRPGPENQPELNQALRETACALESLVPRQARRTRRSKAADAVPSLQEAKRKAIWVALQAGVAPGQVAKHFGLPLAAVRKVLTNAE